MKFYPFYTQQDALDCGPTCLRMIAKYYGKSFSIQNLREKCAITKEGVSIHAISQGAESIGFRALGAKVSFDRFLKAPLPLICHWDQQHFVVVYKAGKDITIADPHDNRIKKIPQEEFIRHWQHSRNDKLGIVLLLEKTAEFDHIQNLKEKIALFSLTRYLSGHRSQLIQLFIGLFIALLLQIIFPFLTQSIVDVGINYQDLNFINLILIAQLVFFASKTGIEFLRHWIMLYVGSKINLSIVSDFLSKLLKLPLRYFDSKTAGDLLQRVGDNSRLEEFLTNSIISTLFSVINLIVFGAILAYYNWTIFLIFLTGSVLYVLWITIFLKRKKTLDNELFRSGVETQSQIIQILNGIGEIKLHNIERKKRWEWESLQASIFKIKINWLKISQYQQLGSTTINELKNILITYYSAKLVISGELTLGMMLSIQYILGQLNSPVTQLVQFVESSQRASISLERLNEVHKENNETLSEGLQLPELKHGAIILQNVSFRYDRYSKIVLKNIELTIQAGKVTAIVGDSGSGKSTLIKLLLKFYNPEEGKIKLGDMDLSAIDHTSWRSQCGAVLQDGFIFNDTIKNNIALKDGDMNNLIDATKMANILDFILSLPLGFNTRIGEDGINVSQGQKQRILLARAIYSNPSYLFLDESTNALDANNEKIIMENLYQFFVGRTVIIIAHRLSTVRNADQIVVLKDGAITEIGNHQNLIERKGDYFTLVRNQLEIATK